MSTVIKCLFLLLAVSFSLCESPHPKEPSVEVPLLKSPGDKVAVDGMDKQDHEQNQFKAFQQKFEKKYDSPKEEQDRFEIFKQNLKTIEMLKATENGTAVYGVTEMADWSKEEFLAKRANLKPVDTAEITKFIKKVNLTSSEAEQIPAEFDWRTTLSVTPVQDQDTCASNWAFATVAHIENLQAIKTGSLQDMSVQHLIDCSNQSHCGSGTFISGYVAAISSGLVPEYKYPFVGRDSTCKAAPKDVAVHVKEVEVFRASEDEMVKYVATKGSTVNMVNAERLQFYVSGVMHPTTESACDPATLNHVMAVVGYGRDAKSGLDYWTAKNSWGMDWGEEGYVRLARGNNTCGISSYFASAVLA